MPQEKQNQANGGRNSYEEKRPDQLIGRQWFQLGGSNTADFGTAVHVDKAGCHEDYEDLLMYD